MPNESVDEGQEYKRFPIMLPNQLKKDLKIIAEKEGHKSLSSFIRSEMIKIRNSKQEYLNDRSDSVD